MDREDGDIEETDDHQEGVGMIERNIAKRGSLSEREGDGPSDNMTER